MIDLIFLFVLTVGLPIMGRVETRRLERAVAASEPDIRVSFYRGTVLLQWGLVAALLVYWWSQGRSAAEIGLAADPGSRFYLALGLALAASVALLLQLVAARRPENRESTAKQFESTKYAP